MFDILGYEFVRNAFAAATIVAIVSGAIGYFLVLRGETFAGHALSHVGFPGATGAVLIGVSPFLGLTVFTLIAGVGISLVGEKAHRDVAIGLVLTVSLGLGLLFLHFYTAYAGMATNLLFGNVLGISAQTVWVLLGLAVVTLGGLLFIGRPLLFASLQPELAEARGVPTARLSALFMVVVALATAEAIQIVGVLLVFALMVAPGGGGPPPDAAVLDRLRPVDRPRRRDRLGEPRARDHHRLADELLDHLARGTGLSRQPGAPARLELDALLRLHARPERVLDLRHLGHEVGDLDQLVLGIAAGDDHVQVARLGPERGEHLIER